ncbi:hematopoietic SH2 domain-containing protein isoform X1 [Alexandromys fortis]|uniref:hematopoietic SH2 domain-containing protein isoform X1 n=1 Tax=Alexandromys fortis TaxID=100897 RepID=UPI0021532A68|nr:hematopoietic SH2 domain-containing protein isoform X1 [Microtus fortis]XP_049984413.1 hematopoietic SH2 domain-containing protein isoform X1 [Microtus fortis]
MPWQRQKPGSCSRHCPLGWTGLCTPRRTSWPKAGSQSGSTAPSHDKLLRTCWSLNHQGPFLSESVTATWATPFPTKLLRWALEVLCGNWRNRGTVSASQPQQCLHRAQTCCRHFMVKLSDNGTFILAGDHTTHASLDALVSFHQQKPIRPYGELLTQACGQEDPANVDYENLFLYSSALAQGAESLAGGLTEGQRPASCPPEEAPERKPSTATDGRLASAPSSPKALFGEAKQKLWKNLRTLPETSRRVKQRITSHLSTTNLLEDARPVAQHHRAMTRASSWDSAHHSTGAGAGAATSTASRPASWREAVSGVKAWREKLVRALSVQATKSEPVDLPEAQDWLPEEYLPPPPFAPGY